MTPKFPTILLQALIGIPPIRFGDDLAGITCSALRQMKIELKSSDILVFAQKIVSKAEGRMIDLSTVMPSVRAEKLATVTGKDPRLVELILSESNRVVRAGEGILIVEHRLGFVMANAGIDQSNLLDGRGDSHALLLPVDPDSSAQRLRKQVGKRCGVEVAVLINDSFGRPWRIGTVGVAIGSAGIPSVLDMRGCSDLGGRTLRATVVAVADEIAASASLVMGQAAEGQPIVLVRGMTLDVPPTSARSLIRPEGENLFR